MVFFGSNRFSELVGFPKIFCACVDRQSSACRNSRIFEDVRHCSIFPEVTEDVLFAELVESDKRSDE